MLASLLAAAVLAQEAPLPEGNAYVRGLVAGQRRREEAINNYTYDVEEVTQESSTARGSVTKVETRRHEVFHVKGRAVRKLVSENGRPLSPAQADAEERRVREKVGDILGNRTAYEMPEVRLSQVLERYDFKAVRREDRAAHPGVRPRPCRQAQARACRLAPARGRIWVDGPNGSSRRRRWQRGPSSWPSAWGVRFDPLPAPALPPHRGWGMAARAGAIRGRGTGPAGRRLQGAHAGLLLPLPTLRGRDGGGDHPAPALTRIIHEAA
jgi:hypothetical protein